MSFWSQQPDIEVRMPVPGKEPFEPFLHLRWADEACVAEAWMDRVGQSLRLTYLRIDCKTGIPAEVRRLPSDGQVLRALRDAGTTGIASLAHVLNDQQNLSEAFHDAGGGQGPTPSSEVMERARQIYFTEFMKRPRKRIDAEVTEVVGWLDEGWSSRRIVEELESRGRGERTAYRRIEDAKNLIEARPENGGTKHD